jgi:hypothetical protein
MPNIIRMIISRRTIWAKNVAWEEERSVYKVFVGKPGGKKY